LQVRELGLEPDQENKRKKSGHELQKLAAFQQVKKGKFTTQWRPAYLSRLSELQGLLYAADMEKYYNTHTQIKNSNL
jgi:hypothetical protein